VSSRDGISSVELGTKTDVPYNELESHVASKAGASLIATTDPLLANLETRSVAVRSAIPTDCAESCFAALRESPVCLLPA
jgi:hypothetical protein